MSIVQTRSVTVTHVDVLHVAQQIKRDLQQLRKGYPRLVDADLILDLHDAVVTFLSNDAVSQLGFSVVDPVQQNLILHELRYNISYTGTGPRVGLGGAEIIPVQIPRTAQMTAWVAWSPTMLALTTSEQRTILNGTGWALPGAGKLSGRYSPGSWAGRGIYSSGVLAAESQEFRRK